MGSLPKVPLFLGQFVEKSIIMHCDKLHKKLHKTTKFILNMCKIKKYQNSSMFKKSTIVADISVYYAYTVMHWIATCNNLSIVNKLSIGTEWAAFRLIHKYVTPEHKTSQKGSFEIDASSESWIDNIYIDVWFGQYL